MSSFGGDNPPPLPDVTDAQQPPQTSQSGQPTQRTQASQTGTKRKSTQDPYASDVRSHGAPPRELSLEEILNSLYADIQHWERPWSPKDGMQGEEASKTDNERQETNVDFTSAPHTPVSKLGPWGTVACLSCKSRRPLRDLETTRRRVANIWKDALTVINSRDRIWSPETLNAIHETLTSINSTLVQVEEDCKGDLSKVTVDVVDGATNRSVPTPLADVLKAYEGASQFPWVRSPRERARSTSNSSSRSPLWNGPCTAAEYVGRLKQLENELKSLVRPQTDGTNAGASASQTNDCAPSKEESTHGPPIQLPHRPGDSWQ